MYIEKWTKPMKHRRLHILKRFISKKVWNIRYVIYNILSKYNIIYKKHYYVDDVVEDSVDLDIFGRAKTDKYLVDLWCTYTNTLHIREEYFYRNTKFGQKIVMDVTNEHYYSTDFLFSIKGSISINIKDGKNEDHWFTVKDNEHNIRVCSLSELPVKSFDQSEPLTKYKVMEKVFDLTRIKSLHYRHTIPVSSSELSKEELMLVKNDAERAFSQALNDIPLGSLIV